MRVLRSKLYEIKKKETEDAQAKEKEKSSRNRRQKRKNEDIQLSSRQNNRHRIGFSIYQMENFLNVI